MSYEPYLCDLDPETKTTLKIYLVKNVQNVEDIRSNIIKGIWKCAVIKPSLILDVFQVAVAANRAVLSEKSQTMVTRSVYAEILFNLSLSKNISQSLSKFGVDNDQAMLVCFLINTDSDESDTIIKEIKGELAKLSELENYTDIKELKSVYKLDTIKFDVNLLDVIVTKIATKYTIAH